MEIKSNFWRKFIECECNAEGIMVSCDDDDPAPYLYLAIFSHGKYDNKELSFREKLRYCWHVLKTGHPFDDEIMLRQETAKELADYLLEFANRKYEDKK